MRLALLPGRPGKPTILVTKDYKIFLGNLTDEELKVDQGELFGFGTGNFEVKLISGSLAFNAFWGMLFGVVSALTGVSTETALII